MCILWSLTLHEIRWLYTITIVHTHIQNPTGYFIFLLLLIVLLSFSQIFEVTVSKLAAAPC